MNNDFFDKVASIIEKARTYVGRTADLTMCITYFEVGRMIVEEEQGGKVRAEYGKGQLKELSKYLGARVGKGFSFATLKNARQFYLTYAPSIQQTTTTESKNGKSQSMISLFGESELYPFKVSWTHYLILMRIQNEQERKFYETEAANEHWTVRQLQRQYGSSLYERLAQSRNKDEVMRLAKEGQTSRFQRIQVFTHPNTAYICQRKTYCSKSYLNGLQNLRKYRVC